jgi:hypothetical protein
MTDLSFDFVKSPETLHQEHHAQLHQLQNKNFNKHVKPPGQRELAHIREVLDAGCKLYMPKLDKLHGSKPIDEISQHYKQNKPYIEPKFEKAGMLENFHEYVGINQYVHSKGDTLNFKDFLNVAIIDFGGMPQLLRDILDHILDF